MRHPENGSATFHGSGGGRAGLSDGSKDAAMEGGATSLDLPL
jgi:hypothetical protein